MKTNRSARALVFLMLIAASISAYAQQISIELYWISQEKVSSVKGEADGSLWFDGAYPSRFDVTLPEFSVKVPLSNTATSVDVKLRNPRFETIQDPQALAQLDPETSLNIISRVNASRSSKNASITIFPFRKNINGTWEKLISAELELLTATGGQQRSSMSFEEHSKLASGEWYRIPVPKDGVYRLSRSYMQSLGIDVSTIDPDQINVYGNDSGLLPYLNAEFRYDDLQLKDIEFIGGDDGSFDSNDYIRFYARGPHRWEYDTDEQEFRHTKHLFMDVAYIFIGIGVDPPARIGSHEEPGATATEIVSTFDDYSFHEEDLDNVIKSGRRMVGEQFGLSGQLSFSGSDFSFSDIDTQSPVKIRLRGVSRTVGSAVFSTMSFSSQGNTESFTLQGTSPSSYTVTRSKEHLLEFLPNSGNLSVTASFTPGGTDADGWVDYLSLNVRRQLKNSSGQLIFRDVRSVGAGEVLEFRVDGSNTSDHLWDVTDPIHPKRIAFDLQDNEAVFKAPGDELREYVHFSDSEVLTPGSGVQVANQDLHGSPQYDMVILSAVPFLTTAEKVADIHRAEGLDVLVVDPQTVYNEFSCGMQDITAVKMFLKMLYDRAAGNVDLYPDYLLLLGDGNFDNSNIDPSTSIYLPTYQSAESNSLTRSFVTDDYFGMLDDNEGELGGDVDVGIGRFPVRNVADAEAIYQKIVRYTDRNTGVVNGVCQDDENTVYGDWKNKVLLVGDDEDNNLHMSQADALGDVLEATDDDYVINKVLLDAYAQESTPGGARYPQAADEISRSIENGVFIVSYTGHGGEVGWAAERILDVPTIQNFNNSNALPLLLTATCEFSRFDDPGRTSAGEFILLNPNGGVIGLLTTTRLVYANDNFSLSRNFFNVVALGQEEECNCFNSGVTYDLPHGMRFGDMVRISKNCTGGDEVNKANFSLLGDPALRLSYPELDILTDSILDVNGNQVDTLKALQRVRIVGHVEEDGQLATDFNGVVEPSVYDKPEAIETLANDGGNVFSFEVRNSVIYKGRATASNGRFSFDFIVPKDISYQQGQGKVHYYGIADDTDAQGSRGGFEVGGTDESAADDDIGPLVELYLNSESFVDGGLTGESPMIIAKVYDDNGVNTVGNGIGHDVTAVLDGNTADPIILNDYYESDLDSYQSGQVRYQLKDLAEGEHTLRFKIWDIYNNSSTKELTFIVEKEEDLVLDNVLNYPNPFTTRTEFLFEHNQSCAFLDVEIQIYTVSGKLVKTIGQVIDTQLGIREQLVWDGKDEFGDRLGRGVYVYRLKVGSPDGKNEEVFEKLVLL